MRSGFRKSYKFLNPLKSSCYCLFKVDSQNSSFYTPRVLRVISEQSAIKEVLISP